MNKINYLFTLCAILFGFTINAQNVAISDKSASLSWTQDTELTNSIVIGANSVNAAGATDASQNVGIGILALDNLKFGDNNTVLGYKAGTAIGGADNGSVLGGTYDSGSGNTLIGRAAGYQIGAGEFNTVVVEHRLESKLLRSQGYDWQTSPFPTVLGEWPTSNSSHTAWDVTAVASTTAC